MTTMTTRQQRSGQPDNLNLNGNIIIYFLVLMKVTQAIRIFENHYL
jgi:hypothetical protein